jgi:hypothetical protein
MAVLRKDLNLLIDDFGEDDAFARPIHDYYRLLKDYMNKLAHHYFVIHTREGYVGY